MMIFEVVNGKKILRDGRKYRVPTKLMDGANQRPRVTDATGDSGLGLHKPGFRGASDSKEQAIAAAKRIAAYDEYERTLTSAYKQDAVDDEDEMLCPRCGGSRLAENGRDECPVCNGDGSVPSDYEGNEDEAFDNAPTHHEGLGAPRTDSRSVEQMMRDHQNKMADIYDKLDHTLSEAWRRS
jgi:hypothetical protein